MHGLIFEISISRLAGSTRYPFPQTSRRADLSRRRRRRACSSFVGAEADFQRFQNRGGPLARSPSVCLSPSSRRHLSRPNPQCESARSTASGSVAGATKAAETRLVLSSRGRRRDGRLASAALSLDAFRFLIVSIYSINCAHLRCKHEVSLTVLRNTTIAEYLRGELFGT